MNGEFGPTRKVCRKCNIEKDITEFYKHSKTLDRRQSYCKKCSHERRMQYGQYHKSHKKKEGKLIKYHCEESNHIATTSELIKSLLSKIIKKFARCKKCGEDDSDCLQFHHLDKFSKSFTLSNEVKDSSVTLASFLREIMKCEILCANCHSKIHRNRETPLFADS